MAYRTGSGTYTDLMDDVLAHAVADGWVEAGGVGTGWPISKGNVRGVDWATQTEVVTDWTFGSSVSLTKRIIKINLDTSTANATSNVLSSQSIVENCHWPISEWHIFSEPAVCDHINVVFRVTSDDYSDIWNHFSFGELDRRGLASGHVAYTAAQRALGFSEANISWTNFYPSKDRSWMNLFEHRWMFGGAVGNRRDECSGFQFLLDPTDLPVAVGAGWPSADTVFRQGASVWHFNNIMTEARNIDGGAGFQDSNSVNSQFLRFDAQPFSGNLSLAAMPIYIANGSGSENLLVWAGQAPNVRMCSVKDYNAGDEVTYGSDTWVVFPVLRKTEMSELGIQNTVASGPAGYAYKKVL